jgi:hypothetical protein
VAVSRSAAVGALTMTAAWPRHRFRHANRDDTLHFIAQPQTDGEERVSQAKRK